MKLVVFFAALALVSTGGASVRVVAPPATVPDVLAFTRDIDAADAIELYEGLPHPLFDQAAYKLEAARGHTLKITTELFYAAKLEPAADLLAQLARVTMDLRGHRTLFVPLSQASTKFCGGFHADYALVWKTKNETRVTALVCFGCAEIRLIRGGETVTADFKPERHRELIALFKPMRRNRPLTDFYRTMQEAVRAGVFDRGAPPKVELKF